LDTKRTICGGVTPVKWEPRALEEKYGHKKGDDSLRSFLFMLRDRHGLPPRILTLMKEKRDDAIWCSSIC
jgi:hypothetical protein